MIIMSIYWPCFLLLGCLSHRIDTVKCRYNPVHLIAILHMVLQWQQQSVNQSWNPQQAPHTSPSGVRIRKKMDRVITTPHCIAKCINVCLEYKAATLVPVNRRVNELFYDFMSTSGVWDQQLPPPYLSLGLILPKTETNSKKISIFWMLSVKICILNALTEMKPKYYLDSV